MVRRLKIDLRTPSEIAEQKRISEQLKAIRDEAVRRLAEQRG